MAALTKLAPDTAPTNILQSLIFLIYKLLMAKGRYTVQFSKLSMITFSFPEYS